MSETADPRNTMLNEIQRWKEDTLDVEFLCQEDLMKEDFFFNLIQCQKDQLYDFYVREETRLMRWTYSLSNDVKFHLKEKKSSSATSAYSYLPVLNDLMGELKIFQEFIVARENDFIKIFNVYDNLHQTNMQCSELNDLRCTHTFLNGKRLLYLEEKVKRRISSISQPSGRKCHNSRRLSGVRKKRLADHITSATSSSTGTIVTTSSTSNEVRDSLRSSLCTIPENFEKHCDQDNGCIKKSGNNLFSLKFFRKLRGNRLQT